MNPKELAKKSTDELIAIIAEKNKELQDQEVVVLELKKEVELKKDVAAPKTGKLGGKTYLLPAGKVIIPPFGDSADYKEVSAEDIAGSKELLEYLVKSGSGVISEITAK